MASEEGAARGRAARRRMDDWGVDGFSGPQTSQATALNHSSANPTCLLICVGGTLHPPGAIPQVLLSYHRKVAPSTIVSLYSDATQHTLGHVYLSDEQSVSVTRDYTAITVYFHVTSGEAVPSLPTSSLTLPLWSLSGYPSLPLNPRWSIIDRALCYPQGNAGSQPTEGISSVCTLNWRRRLSSLKSECCILVFPFHDDRRQHPRPPRGRGKPRYTRPHWRRPSSSVNLTVRDLFAALTRS